MCLLFIQAPSEPAALVVFSQPLTMRALELEGDPTEKVIISLALISIVFTSATGEVYIHRNMCAPAGLNPCTEIRKD